MRLTRRDVILGAAGVALVAAHPARAETRSIGGPAFGSSWRATFEKARGAEELRARIQSVIADVDACFSPYRADSDLSQFNATRTQSWRSADPMFADLVHEALRIAELSDGYFDPTVGPLVARLGFGPIIGRASSFHEIDIAAGRVRKSSVDATLDLCGVAKGYALDRIIAMLEATGVSRAIVDVGGEVKAIGSHPDGRAWTVAVIDPSSPGKARHIVAPRGRALATSGHSANGIRARVSASHIIDPRRQMPAVQSLLSVSVLERSAMKADALATALCAAGPSGPDLARRLGVRAFFIFESDEQMTANFEEHILV